MKKTRFAKLLELANDIEHYRFDYTDAEGVFYDQLAIKGVSDGVRSFFPPLAGAEK
jgi:hypothetical protein